MQSVLPLVVVISLPGMPYCVYDIGPDTLRLINLLSSIPRSVVGILLLILAISQTLRRSIGMYKMTRQWQFNKYMKLFVKDGMLFFVLYVSPSRRFCIVEKIPLWSGVCSLTLRLRLQIQRQMSNWVPQHLFYKAWATSITALSSPTWSSVYGSFTIGNPTVVLKGWTLALGSYRIQLLGEARWCLQLYSRTLPHGRI